MRIRIPKPVRKTLWHLQKNGFQAFLVGGAVRDLRLNRNPKDWDIATEAKPKEIVALFQKTIPIGQAFGTITVVMDSLPIQVTTFRAESAYRDGRRPSNVSFHDNLEADLARRDFTINAMAYEVFKREWIDPFNGICDLKRKLLQTVGKAHDRFSEDALRIIRAGRFIAELQFRPKADLTKGAKRVVKNVSMLSAERIRDELKKLLVGAAPRQGLTWLDTIGALKQIIPELEPLKGVRQGGWHCYDVFHHTLRAIDASPPDLSVRVALLFHDLAKPECRTRDRDGYHFYGHEKKSAKRARPILTRLRFSNAFIADVCALIEHHLFEVEAICKNDSAIRRLIRRVGEERIERLIQLRKADIYGCGPSQKPSPGLLELERRIRRMQRSRPPLQISDLAVDGTDLVKWLKIQPGPKVGQILQLLLDEVLADPSLNDRKRLKSRTTKALRNVNNCR